MDGTRRYPAKWSSAEEREYRMIFLMCGISVYSERKQPMVKLRFTELSWQGCMDEFEESLGIWGRKLGVLEAVVLLKLYIHIYMCI